MLPAMRVWPVAGGVRDADGAPEPASTTYYGAASPVAATSRSTPPTETVQRPKIAHPFKERRSVWARLVVWWDSLK
jgi:hypothetical protein